MTDLRDLGITASGGIGHEWVYQKNGVRRSWVIPTNPQTEEQQAWRNKFSDVLCELMIAGSEWRQYLRDSLGTHWHARIIGRCLASDGLYFTARLQEFEAFDLADREEWASYDNLGELVNEHGAVFFCVASKAWEELHALGIDPGYSRPGASNSAEVAVVWPREVGAMFLTKEQADDLYALLAHLHDDRYLQSVPQQDHGGLAGLSDDDHSQYYNQTRGDDRYVLRTVQARAWLPFGVFSAVSPLTGNQNPYAVAIDRTVTFVSWVQSCYVVAPNSASHYWRIILLRMSDGATVKEINTSAVAADGGRQITTSSFDIASVGTAGIGVYIQVQKVGSPGVLYLHGPMLEITC